MPRSSGRSGGGRAGGRAPTRPTVAAPAKNPYPQQTRTAATAAHPPASVQQPQQAQSSGGGLFGQMASTAAGVAVGSSIGHAIGGFFGGGGSAPAEQPQQTNAVSQPLDSNQNNSWAAPNCELDSKNFVKCLDDNRGDMNNCGWYLQQLKACQQAASQY